MMRIDTHQHFWQYNPQRHAWIDSSMTRIKQDFLLKDLLPVLSANNIDGCISVEAHSSEDETNFLLDLAESNDFIKGVIGWVDLLDIGIPNRLKYFAAYPKFKGVRYAVQSEQDINFMLREDFQNGLNFLKDYNLIYEILIFPQHLSAAIKCVEKNHQQKFVLNHIAKPFIKDKKIEPWASHIKELAANPNVYCKLSGMVTEADPDNWQEQDITPYLDVVLNAFGVSRVMFGSDWPVCLLAAEYKQVISLLEKYIGIFNPNDQNKIMGLNAAGFYGLK